MNDDTVVYLQVIPVQWMIELVFIGVELYESLFYKNMKVSMNIIKKYKVEITSNWQEATT